MCCDNNEPSDCKPYAMDSNYQSLCYIYGIWKAAPKVALPPLRVVINPIDPGELPNLLDENIQTRSSEVQPTAVSRLTSTAPAVNSQAYSPVHSGADQRDIETHI